MYVAAPHLARIDATPATGAADLAGIARLAGSVLDAPFAPVIGDFYMTNPIARASAVMAELSALKAGRSRAQAAE
jgi:NADH-quinone oxidoreductase subunit G